MFFYYLFCFCLFQGAKKRGNWIFLREIVWKECIGISPPGQGMEIRRVWASRTGDVGTQGQIWEKGGEKA